MTSAGANKHLKWPLTESQQCREHTCAKRQLRYIVNVNNESVPWTHPIGERGSAPWSESISVFTGRGGEREGASHRGAGKPSARAACERLTLWQILRVMSSRLMRALSGQRLFPNLCTSADRATEAFRLENFKVKLRLQSGSSQPDVWNRK